MAVRQRLAELMARAGVSQAELARRIGEERDWVNRRMSGRVSIGADEIPRLAEAVGAAPCDFFEGEHGPEAESPIEQAARQAANLVADRIHDVVRQELVAILAPPPEAKLTPTPVVTETETPRTAEEESVATEALMDLGIEPDDRRWEPAMRVVHRLYRTLQDLEPWEQELFLRVAEIRARLREQEQRE